LQTRWYHRRQSRLPVGAATENSSASAYLAGGSDGDLHDYNSLAGNFTPPGYGVVAAPEPASLFLLLAGLPPLFSDPIHAHATKLSRQSYRDSNEIPGMVWPNQLLEKQIGAFFWGRSLCRPLAGLQ
jgi:hypothetical protein